MSTDEDVEVEQTAAEGQAASSASGRGGARRQRRLRPWHRDHPAWAPLAGFFTGFFLVIAALVLLGWLVEEVFDYDVTSHPWILLVAVAVVFVVNVALLVRQESRRFARYMLFGVLVTPVVIFGVGALTTYLLIRSDG